jgi:hypothetical protein
VVLHLTPEAAGLHSEQGDSPAAFCAFNGAAIYPAHGIIFRLRASFSAKRDIRPSTKEAKSSPMATQPISRASAKRRIRKIFGDIHEVTQMPNLIQVQRESYEQFLRSDPSVGYVSGLERRCVRCSRSATLPAPANWTSSITS